jgi:hypothetical protein
MKNGSAPPLGEPEFLALAEDLGIDPGARVDPRTELSFAMARRKCSKCTSKKKCRQALRQRGVTLSEVASFYPPHVSLRRFVIEKLNQQILAMAFFSKLLDLARWQGSRHVG